MIQATSHDHIGRKNQQSSFTELNLIELKLCCNGEKQLARQHALSLSSISHELGAAMGWVTPTKNFFFKKKNIPFQFQGTLLCSHVEIDLREKSPDRSGFNVSGIDQEKKKCQNNK